MSGAIAGEVPARTLGPCEGACKVEIATPNLSRSEQTTGFSDDRVARNSKTTRPRTGVLDIWRPSLMDFLYSTGGEWVRHSATGDPPQG